MGLHIRNLAMPPGRCKIEFMVWSVSLGIIALAVSEFVSVVLATLIPFLKGGVVTLSISILLTGMIYYLGVKTILKKSPSLLDKNQPRLLKVALVLIFLAWFAVLVGQPIKEIYEIGLILNFVADTLVAFGTIQFAQNKGRSGFWGILGIIGLIIAFCLPSKPKTILPDKEKTSVLDYLLGGVLSVGLFGQSLFMVSQMPPKITSPLSVSPDIYLLLFLFALIIVLFSLITNRRQLLSIALWCSAITSFISLFFYPDKNAIPQYFVHIRNWFYLCLIVYPIVHLLIHGIAKLIKHKRQIISPTGMVEYRTLIYTFTFLWAVWDLVTRIFNKL
jgi:hypothetical protein